MWSVSCKTLVTTTSVKLRWMRLVNRLTLPSLFFNKNRTLDDGGGVIVGVGMAGG